MRAQAGDNHPDMRAALEHILSSGGKRVRPTVVLLVGNMLDAPEEKLVTVGAAIELLHTATLVHDDLIDGSLLRRGMPTLNARWSPAATVLTGDFLFARAAELAAEADHLPLMKLFAETLAIIVNGELTQLAPQCQRGLVVDNIDLAEGLQGFLQPLHAIAHRRREILDADGGDRFLLSLQALVPQALG